MHPYRLVVCAAALAIVGCAPVPEPRQSLNSPPLTGKTTFPPDLGHGAPRLESEISMMYIPVEIQHFCSGMDPKFEYNATGIESNDNRSLQILAVCMKDGGALAGKTIRLVGHADVRGSEPYNDRLGKKRAESVKLYLMKSGIASDRLVTDSEGKTGALAPAEDWDRRVDFQVMP